MRFRNKIVIFTSAVMVLASMPMAAQAETTFVGQDSTQVASVATSSPVFSDTDVVDLFLFGGGPIASAHPALAAKLVPNPSSSVSEAQVASATAQLLTQDPNFNANVTIPIQSGDPYTVQSGIQAFRADVAAIAKPTGDGGVATGDCIVGIWFFVGSAVAVLVVAVAGAAVVTLYAAVNAYLPSSEGTAFDLQKFSADLAHTL